MSEPPAASNVPETTMRATVESIGIEYDCSIEPDAQSSSSGMRDDPMARNDWPTSACTQWKRLPTGLGGSLDVHGIHGTTNPRAKSDALRFEPRGGCDRHEDPDRQPHDRPLLPLVHGLHGLFRSDRIPVIGQRLAIGGQRQDVHVEGLARHLVVILIELAPVFSNARVCFIVAPPPVIG